MGVRDYTPIPSANEDFATVPLVEQSRADALDLRYGESGAGEVRHGAAMTQAKVCESREHRLRTRVVAAQNACARVLVGSSSQRRSTLVRERRFGQRVVRG